MVALGALYQPDEIKLMRSVPDEAEVILPKAERTSAMKVKLASTQLVGHRVERRLAAILAADVAGYSRLMGLDEIGTLEALKSHRREVVDPAITAHKGRIVKTTGDGMLAEFASAVDAVTCAMSVQEKMAQLNAGRSNRHIIFRIGINVGDIVVEGDDIFGDGVNVAARVENECEPGMVCLSANAFEHVRGKTPFAFEDIGEKTLKNIDRPVRIYAAKAPNVPDAVPVESTTLLEAKKPLSLSDKASIAVLPFQNMSGDPEQEYFADGMVQEITTALSRFNSLFVIAGNSSFKYKGKAIDAKQVGRELGVRYLLEGSVRQGSGRLRITGQLIEAATGAHLWADKFEGPSDDVFELQDRVTSSVVGVIAPTIERAEIERATRKPTNNLEAYDWYLRGIAVMEQWTHDGSESAIRMFKKAHELDPNNAGAMAWIGGCHSIRALQGWMVDPKKEAAEAIHYARASQELGRNDAHVLARNALTIAIFVGDIEAANSLVERALSLNPNQVLGSQASGWIKLFLGEPQLAIEHFLRSLQLNPFDSLNGNVMSGLAWAHFLTGEFKEAEIWVRKALVYNPNYLPALRASAAVDAVLGRLQRAQETADHILQLNPSESTSTAMMVRIARRPNYRAKVIEFLRLAGVPE